MSAGQPGQRGVCLQEFKWDSSYRKSHRGVLRGVVLRMPWWENGWTQKSLGVFGGRVFGGRDLGLAEPANEEVREERS